MFLYACNIACCAHFTSHQAVAEAARVWITATSPAPAVTPRPAPSRCANQSQTFVRSGQGSRGDNCSIFCVILKYDCLFILILPDWILTHLWLRAPALLSTAPCPLCPQVTDNDSNIYLTKSECRCSCCLDILFAQGGPSASSPSSGSRQTPGPRPQYVERTQATTWSSPPGQSSGQGWSQSWSDDTFHVRDDCNVLNHYWTEGTPSYSIRVSQIRWTSEHFDWGTF